MIAGAEIAFSRASLFREEPAVRLRKAAIEGNVYAVKRLIKKVPNIQCPDSENGWTILMYAARHGHIQLVKFLLENEHEDKAISVDGEGTTVLMIAAQYDQDEIFYTYAEHYPPSIHATNRSGCTALLFAAKVGNEDLIYFLLNWGADIDHVDDDGNTALHYAAGWGHTKSVTILIDRGCNANLANRQGWTAANYAYSFSLEARLKELTKLQYEARSTKRLVRPVALIQDSSSQPPQSPSFPPHLSGSPMTLPMSPAWNISRNAVF